MGLEDVILSSRAGARRGRPGPPPRGGAERSRASQALLDAAMDDYWKQDDDDATAAPVLYELVFRRGFGCLRRCGLLCFS